MPARRRRKSCKGAAEDQAMASAQWSGLREQERLERIHHSEDDNKKARERTRALLAGGWSAVDWG